MRLDSGSLLTIMLVACLVSVLIAAVMGRLDGLSWTETVMFAILAGGVTALMSGIIFYLLKIAVVIE